MSTIDRWANAIRNGDRDALYNAMLEIGRFMDRSNVASGGIQGTKVDDPGNAARPVSVPPLANVTVSGSTGSFKVSITSPQAVNALSANQRIAQLNQNPGINVPATMLYHQVQSATDQTFSANVNLVDHGISPQTVYTIPDTGYIKYFRIRSSYDQKSWNQWQVKAAGDSGASNLTLQTHGSDNENQNVLNLTGNVSQDQQGNIVIGSSDGLPMPADKFFTLWRPQVPATDNHWFTLFDSLATAGNSGTISYHVGSSTQTPSVNMVLSNITSNTVSGGQFTFYTGRRVVMESRLRMINAVDGLRIWLGFSTSGDLWQWDTTVGKGVSFIGFYFNPLVSANWLCVLGTTAGIRQVDTGILPSLLNYITFRVEADGLKCDFYINDVLIASFSDYYDNATVMSTYLSMAGLNILGIIGNGMSVQYVYAETPTV